MTASRTPPSIDVDDASEAARGTVYGTLAALYEEPDETMFQALADGRVAAEIDELLEYADVDVTVPSLSTDDDYELLCARFNDVFEIGYPDPPVPLYESSHRSESEWNDINLDLARAYDYFGVSIDETVRDHHDHLQLELEFAGYLARLAATDDGTGVRRARRDFLDRHLEPFVTSVATAIDDEVETGIYSGVVALTDAFVTADLADLESDTETEVVHQ